MSSSLDPSPATGVKFKSYARRLLLSWVGCIGLAEVALAATELPSGHIGTAMWGVLLGFWMLHARHLGMRVEDLTPGRAIGWSEFCERVADNLPEEDREAVEHALTLALASELAQ